MSAVVRLGHRAAVLAIGLPFVVGAAVAGADSSQPRRVVLTLTDPAIVESSGLASTGGFLVTVNDSGDTGRTFVVDASGATVGHATWGGATDVEALAPIGSDLLVGDIGDNRAQRPTVSLLRVPVAAGERAVDPATAVELFYPDGPRDAETLMVDPVSGRVLIASKVLLGGTLYEVPPAAVPPRVGAPAPVEPVRLEPLGRVRGFATDGAFFPDGRHLVVRDYTAATVYSWPDLEDVGSFDLPEQEQGEGIAVDEVDGEHRVLLSSEGAGSEVLRATLPQALAEAVAPVAARGAGDGSPGDGSTGGATGPSVTDDGPVPIDGDRVETTTPLYPWLLGGGVMLVMLVLLVRSLRPR